MSLIKCKECGKEISDKASVCPNCGAPVIRYVNPSSRMNIVEVNDPKSNDDSWTMKYKRYKPISILIYFLIMGMLIGLFVFLFSSLIIREFSIFYIFGIFPTFICIFLCLNAVISAFSFSCYKKATYNGYTVVISIVEVIFRTKKKVLINNKVYQCTKSPIYFKLNEECSFQVILSGKNSSIKLVKTESLVKPIPVTNGAGPVVITNYIKSSDAPTQNNKNEKSEIEKKVLKNAKIDALASINPNDTEDAKEKINLYKELDNLDTK